MSEIKYLHWMLYSYVCIYYLVYIGYTAVFWHVLNANLLNRSCDVSSYLWLILIRLENIKLHLMFPFGSSLMFNWIGTTFMFYTGSIGAFIYKIAGFIIITTST